MEKAEHEKRVMEKVRLEEELDRFATEGIRAHMLQYLKADRGYGAGELEVDLRFIVDGEPSSVDFIITVDGKRLMAVKCAPTALESRERHILAFCRVVHDCLIPMAVVTDGTEARLLDTATGRLVSETMEGIPRRAGLDISAFSFIKCPERRLEKEKLILRAYNSISCPRE